MKKIISTTLISCMLIQIVLTQPGCTSFYPAPGKDLSMYENSDDEIQIKLNDNSELRIKPSNSFFVDTPSDFIYVIGREFNYSNKKLSDFKGVIEKDKVDSINSFEANENHYRIYWLNDSRKISSEQEVFSLTPDSGSGFWLVLDENKNEIRKVYDKDIYLIERKQVNWAATSALILAGALIVTYIILDNFFSWEGSLLGKGSL